MKCESCTSEAVISCWNGTFCRSHFISTFERTALGTIKKFNLIAPGERIGIANSGGKDSLSLLKIIADNFDKSKIVSITIDEGIEGYRDKTIAIMKKYCDLWGIKYKIYSYKDFAGADMDKIVKIKKGIPCGTCGIIRRYLLNLAAKENSLDKIATAHNLDDECESVLMNVFQNDLEKTVRLGPRSGIMDDDGFVPRIKPFLLLSEKETMMYAILNGINALHTPCPYAGLGFRGLVSRKVKEMEDIMPGSKRNVVDVLLKIKSTFKTEKVTNLMHCSSCGAPSSENMCSYCITKNELAGT